MFKEKESPLQRVAPEDADDDESEDEGEDEDAKCWWCNARGCDTVQNGNPIHAGCA